jgi:PAT family beta-lactamase induction signal transducer AmpG
MMGYPGFFIWVLLVTIPSFIVVALIPLDPDFGRKKSEVP